MIAIDVIPEMQLTPADDAAIAAVLTLAFPGEFVGRSYHKQRHHLRIVARAEGAVVGHVALLFRTIRLGPDLVPVVGVAEVATHPDQRGQGIAGAMLAQAIAQSQQSMARFMVLFGHRPLYAGHGFVRHANALTYVVLDDVRSGAVVSRVDDDLMVLALGDQAWDAAAPVDLVGHIF